MNTDQLLQPISMTHSQIIALMDVVKANTAAFKEIRKDLGQCNSQEKVQAIINKVEMAVQDLAIESQKIPPWVKDVTGIEPTGSSGSEFYGQYIINQPLNPDNPVPWPPGYAPPAADDPQAQQQQQQVKKEAAPQQVKKEAAPPSPSPQMKKG